MFGFKDLHFRIVTSQAANIQFEPSSCEHSLSRLPYPKLQHLVQSVLDCRDMVSLADVIDGMDLSKDWGSRNLDLTQLNDLCWANWANERLAKAAM